MKAARMGGRFLAWGGNLGALDDVAAAGGLGRPLIMYTVILAPQRVAGALRRRGGLVDVVRRPSRNDNSSNAGAV